ncbi:unnamed protein product, partial [Rotaria sordida]
MIGSKSHSAVPSSSSQSISTFFTVDIRNKSHATRLAKHKLKKAIAECCILDNRPFALADGPGFQKIIHETMSIGLDIRNKSRATRLAKHKLKKAIAECCIFDSRPFALADGPDFQKIIHETMSIGRSLDLPNSKSPNIRAFTEGILSELDLTINENVYIVTDNEPKMKAAFRDGAKRIGCSAHYVNKIIEHSLTSIDIGCDLIQQTFNQVKTIVTHIRQTHIQTKLSHSINLFCKTSICPQLKDEFYDVLKEEMNKRQSLEPKTHTTSAKLTTASATLKRKRTNLLADCYDPDPDPLDETISNDETEIE